MPQFFIATTFLGEPCGTGPSRGVNPEMNERLLAAENAIRATYDALAPEQRTDAATGQPDASFRQWSGISGPHVCWLPDADHHRAGAAIDINVAQNHYIVTRNGGTPGGQAGAETFVKMRNRTLAVFDRAMRFVTLPSATADLSARAPSEPTRSVYKRFRQVSTALARYLSFAVSWEPLRVSRVAIEDADEIADEDLLAAIPEPERLPVGHALAELDRYLDSPEFQAAHPESRADSRTQYMRMLRDYEQARSAMVIGNPSLTPALTWNPVRGFLNLRCEIVESLCDQGLRWGACDFPVKADGSSLNGDMGHFDLADDGGYPEVYSMLRFG